MNVRAADTKEAFHCYADNYGVICPAVCAQEGGLELGEATGNGGVGDGKYIIYPNKICKKTDVIPSSIRPHQCQCKNVEVHYPYDNVILEKREFHTLRWESNVGGSVKIDLFKSGTFYKTISSSTTNDGSHTWNIANDISTGQQFQIRVTSLANDTITGESEGNFCILEEKLVPLPYKQTFDTWKKGRTAYWEHAVGNDLDWYLWAGPGLSRNFPIADKTGPKNGDHTSGKGRYLFVEASYPHNPDKKAVIETPLFDFRSLQNPVLSLYTHMYSGDNQMGSFHVDVKVGAGNWQRNIISVSGDQGDAWRKQSVPLGAITQNNKAVQFRLRGITGSGWQSDICIDDFQIAEEGTGIVTKQANRTSHDVRIVNNCLLFTIPFSTTVFDYSFVFYDLKGKTLTHIAGKKQQPGTYTIPIRKHTSIAKGIVVCRYLIGKTNNVIVFVNK